MLRSGGTDESRRRPGSPRLLRAKMCISTPSHTSFRVRCSVSPLTELMCARLMAPLVVIRGTKEFDKSHLERLIVEHGGDFCQRVMADDDTIVITNSEQAPQAQGAVRKGKSLVKPEWLLESIKAKRRLPLINERVILAAAVRALADDPLQSRMARK